MKTGVSFGLLRRCFKGAFANLQKATIHFVMSVRLSVGLSALKTPRLPTNGFS